MGKHAMFAAVVLGLMAAVLPATSPVSPPPSPVAESPSGEETVRSEAQKALASLPLMFEANEGQLDPRVVYKAGTSAGTAFFTDTGPVFSLPPDTPEVGPPASPGAAIRLALPGGNWSKPVAADPLEGKLNYFIGDDPRDWAQGVPTYGRVLYRDVYPGIDLRFREGTGQTLEYDFVLDPAADPEKVAMRFPGAEGLQITESGDLLIDTPAGPVRHSAPVLYQPSGDGRLNVEGRFDLLATGVGFIVGQYDPSLPLVIDPATDLAYSTFLGGNNVDIGYGIAVEGGAAYVAGYTFDTSQDFPTTTGAYDTGHNGSHDAFVAKITPAGGGTTDLEYSTFLGGSADETAYAIAVDGGAAFVTGETLSQDLPTSTGAYDSGHNGSRDAFFAKITPAGGGAADLGYSTFLGGSLDDVGYAIAVEGGEAFVTGSAQSPGFPTTTGAYDTGFTGAGEAFVAKITPAGEGATDLDYSTFLGTGSGDVGRGIAVDGGAAYVTGNTQSQTFPTTTGAYDTGHNGGHDAFVAKVIPAGGGATDLGYSTFLGGGLTDVGHAIAVDGGAAYVTGDTGSSGFPTTTGAYDTSYNNSDAFVAKLLFDTAAPTVTEVSPAEGATGVAAGANVQITFSEAMDQPSVEAAFSLAASPPVEGAFSWTGNQVTFNPTSDLATDTTYTATVGTGSEDAAGNALAEAEVWTFATVDTTAPTVTEVSPAEGATGVAAGTSVQITFSEAMDHSATEAAFILERSLDGADVAGAFSWTGNQLTFDPTWNLDTDATYNATVGTGAEDAAGNALAEAEVWTFTTIALSGHPANATILNGTFRSGSVGDLSEDDDVYFEVNSTTASTRRTAWYGVINGVPNDLSSLELSYKGKNSRSCTQALFIRNLATNTWTHLDSRSVGTTEILVEETLGGNLADYVSGASGPGQVSIGVQCTTTAGNFFTSADLLEISYGVPQDTIAPSVSSVSPPADATNVEAETTVAVVFSEPMDQDSAESAFSLDSAGISAAAVVGGSFSWSGNTMTFTPSVPLAPGTTYTAEVGTGAQDLAGNPLPEAVTWSFTTPTIVHPSSATIVNGTLRTGSSANLGADDDVYYELNSTTVATRKTLWYGAFDGVPNEVSSLDVTYKGKNSLSCTQKLFIWNFTTNTWIQLDFRSVGTTEVLVEETLGGNLADYVSGASGPGQVAILLQCTTTAGTFFSSADLMEIAYTAP